MMALPKGIKSLSICSLVLMQYMNASDRHPDRRTPHERIGRAIHSVAPQKWEALESSTSMHQLLAVRLPQNAISRSISEMTRIGANLFKISDERMVTLSLEQTVDLRPHLYCELNQDGIRFI